MTGQVDSFLTSTSFDWSIWEHHIKERMKRKTVGSEGKCQVAGNQTASSHAIRNIPVWKKISAVILRYVCVLSDHVTCINGSFKV